MGYWFLRTVWVWEGNRGGWTWRKKAEFGKWKQKNPKVRCQCPKWKRGWSGRFGSLGENGPGAQAAWRGLLLGSGWVIKVWLPLVTVDLRGSPGCWGIKRMIVINLATLFFSTEFLWVEFHGSLSLTCVPELWTTNIWAKE